MNEEELIFYIKGKIGEKVDGIGNITAYNILIHIAMEMILKGSSVNDVKNRIDELLTDPVKKYQSILSKIKHQ